MQAIKLNQIQAHSLQPVGRSRDTIDLQESHRQIGVLWPPILVPDGDGKYTCLAGWRRVTAAKAMGLRDMESDRLAAEAVGVDFMWASDFFK